MQKLTKMLCILIAVSLCIAMLPTTVLASGEYDGKTVVLYTGNIRGDIHVLPQIAAVRADFESKGADVILVDTGNFLQGTRYSTFNSGSTMITLMIAAGYDIVALGRYDFAFGTGTLGTAFHGDAVEFGPLGELLEMNPALSAVSANISGENDIFHSFAENIVVTTGNSISIGFFGLTDITTPDVILESNLTGLQFTDPTIAATAQKTVLADYDLVIGLSNASVPSIPGIIMLDTAPVSVPGMVTIGAVVIDNETMEYTVRNIDIEDYASEPDVETAVNTFVAAVDNVFTQVGSATVMLSGSTVSNRSGETNLGNFWADALRWFAVSGEINEFFDEDDIAIGNDRIHVDADNIVAIWNAGNLRDFIYPGDVTIQDLRRVLPFPNTVAVIYLTGAELLEQLEASAQGLPFSLETYGLTASLMHVSGIEYTVDTTRAFNPGEAYRDRAWFTAQSVERVSITSINGTPFDEAAVYAVITSNANFNGMDISYVLAARESDTQNRSTITTARVVEHAVMGYIASLPNATIGLEYADVQGRITLLGVGAPPANGMTENMTENMTRGMFVNLLYRLSDSPDVDIIDRFADVPPGHRYANAIEWAAQQGLAGGVGNMMFAPDRYITRQELAVLIFRFHGSPAIEGILTFDDAGDIASWAYSAVIYVIENDLMPMVSNGVFAPGEAVDRAAGAAVLARIYSTEAL